jgi:hypothetical protein
MLSYVFLGEGTGTGESLGYEAVPTGFSGFMPRNFGSRDGYTLLKSLRENSPYSVYCE